MATPYKLKDETWGIKVSPPAGHKEGEVVEVGSRKGPYRVVIRRKLFSNDDIELYSVNRLPDMPESGNCPMCGHPVDENGQPARKTNAPEPKGDWKTAKEVSAESNGKAEFDDDIPF